MGTYFVQSTNFENPVTLIFKPLLGLKDVPSPTAQRCQGRNAKKNYSNPEKIFTLVEMAAIGPAFLMNQTARPGIMARRALGITRRNNYPLVGQWVMVQPMPQTIMTANGPITTMPSTGPIPVLTTRLPKGALLKPKTRRRRHRRSKN